MEKMGTEQLKKGLMNCWGCSLCLHTCPFVDPNKDWLLRAPLGKIRAYRYMERWGLSPDEHLHKMIYLCTTCARCSTKCRIPPLPGPDRIPRLVGGPRLIELMRSELYYKYKMPLLSRHQAFMGSVKKNGNPYFEDAEKRFGCLGEPRFEKAEYTYFLGCTSAFRMVEIAQSTWKLFRKLGVDVSLMKNETCCGSPVLRIGLVEEAKKLATKNAKSIQKGGIKNIVTSCAGCFRTLKLDYPELLENPQIWDELGVKIYHSSQIIHQLINDGRLTLDAPEKKISVTYHDPCHIGRHYGLYEEPRDIINSIPDVTFIEMHTNKEDAPCCGAGGGVRAGFKEESLKLAKKRVNEALVTGSQYLLSTCPFCKLNLAEAAEQLGVTKQLKVLDLTELLAHLIHL